MQNRPRTCLQILHHIAIVDVNALPAKNLQRGEHLSLLSLSISLSRWKRGCHLRWNTGSGLWVTTGGGAWARAKLAGATDHGARGQLWNEACTHGSLTLPRNTRYKQHSAAEVPNAKRLSTTQVLPQRCTMTRTRPTWRLAFQHLTPRAVCLGRSV